MDSPARNAPCPCGSGKKWKKCCGAVERQPIAEDESTVTHMADPNAMAGLAQGLFDAMEMATKELDLDAMDQLSAAALVYAMLVKKHRAVEEDAVMLVEKCIKGTFYNPHGFTSGNA